MAEHLVAVMGRGVVAAGRPAIAADDLGLTRGEGCFDSVRVVTTAEGARVVELGEHLRRLRASAAALGIDCPTDLRWQGLVDEALAAWDRPGEAVLKLVLTRGREWAPEEGPTGYLLLSHLRDPGDNGKQGPPPTLTAVTLSRGHPSDAFADAPWLLGGVKTLSYAVNRMAQREARDRGADDVIFTTTDGFALDGPTSGLIVARGGRLMTTPTGATGVLASVTVNSIIAAAESLGFKGSHELIPVDELFTADGVWLVSSGRGTCPIVRLDGRDLVVDSELVAGVRRLAGFG